MPGLYLLKQGHGPSPLFNSHWALLASADPTPADPDPSDPPAPRTPHPDSDSSTDAHLAGTFIHVHGSLLAGFAFEAKRGWSRPACPEPYRAFFVGSLVPGSVLVSAGHEGEGGGGDGDGDGEKGGGEGGVPLPKPDDDEHGWILDPAPRTPLERALLQAPPPPPSLRSPGATGGGVTGAGHGRAGRVQDCQEWIRMALPCAVRAGLVVYAEGVDVDELLSVRNQ